MGYSRPLSSSFQYTRQLTFNINFDNGWIRTADLWCWKQQLYQLSHNHCPLPHSSLSLTPSITLSIYHHFYLSIYHYICLSIYLPIHLSITISICQCINQYSIHLSLSLSIYLPFHLCITISICQSINQYSIAADPGARNRLVSLHFLPVELGKVGH